MWPFSRTKWELKGIPLTSSEVLTILRAKNVLEVLPCEDGHYRALPKKDFEWLLAMKRQLDPRYGIGRFECNHIDICAMADLYRAWAELADNGKAGVAGTPGHEALCAGWARGRLTKGAVAHRWIWAIDDTKTLNWYQPYTNSQILTEPSEIWRLWA